MGVELQPFAPGSKSTGVLPLTPGTWDLAMPYGSPRPLEVQVGERRFTMPAALDRPGPRLPLGTITVGRTEALAIPPQYDRAWGSLGKMPMDPSIGEPMPALGA